MSDFSDVTLAWEDEGKEIKGVFLTDTTLILLCWQVSNQFQKFVNSPWLVLPHDRKSAREIFRVGPVQKTPCIFENFKWKWKYYLCLERWFEIRMGISEWEKMWIKSFWEAKCGWLVKNEKWILLWAKERYDLNGLILLWVEESWDSLMV